MTDTERLSVDELAFHGAVIEQLRVAMAVRDTWLNHLAQKYRLTAGDRVTSDGAIAREEQHQ